MTPSALKATEVALMCSVFEIHPEVTAVTLFGSRAKGAHSEHSDVDLAISGNVEPLGAEAIAGELDELPLPYRFDVLAMQDIKHPPLLEHIQRVGIPIYSAQKAAV